MTEGVDYSTDHPDPGGLAAVGKEFAVRYVGPGTSDKLLTPEEAHGLAAAGLRIVCVAEGGERDLAGGYQVGHDQALSGLAGAVRCGMVGRRPVYLAADWQVTPDEWPAVRDALRGAGDAIGPDRVGIYGSIDVIEWAARDGVAAWFWQTAAWSGGKWSPHAHIQQYRNSVSLVGGTVDLDRATVDDYGQWLPGVEDYMSADYGDLGAPPSVPDYASEHPAVMIADLWSLVFAGKTGWDDVPVGAQSWLARQLAAVDSGGGLAAKVDALTAQLADLAGRFQAIVDAPGIDAVAVARAIAASPDIVATIATGVAQRLMSITGEVTLSGSLQGRVGPVTT